MPQFKISTLEIILALCLAPLAASGWVALATAQLGRFSPSLAGLAAFLALLAVLAMARLAAGRQQLDASGWDFLALAAGLLLLWRAQPAAEPWPVYLDASWYLNTAARIAADGALRFEAEGLSELDRPDLRRLVVASFSDQRAAGLPFPAEPDLGFFAQAFAIDLREGRPAIGPYHPPFFAASLALTAARPGPWRAGAGALPWALAWLLAVATVARLGFGPRAGPLALILAGTGPLFAYYGSQPYAELAAGALLLAGLACSMRLSSAARPAPLPAAGFGLCLGLAGLIKLDLMPALGIGLLWWAICRAPRADWTEHRALLLGLGLPVAHGLLLASGPSRLYYTLNLGGVWRLLSQRAAAIGTTVLGLLVLAVLARLLWRSRPPGRRTGLPDTGRVLALVVVLALASASLMAWLAPESAPPSMIAILSWAATPLGLWAGASGLVLALLEDAPRRRPLLILALTALPLVLLAPVVTRSLSSIYTARRLLPLAWPLLMIFAAGAALHLVQLRLGAGWGGLGGLRRRQAMALSGLLLVFWASLQAARPFVHGSGLDFAGGPALTSQLARLGSAKDMLLFSSTLDGSDAGRLAAAAWALEGRPVALLGSPDLAAESLEALYDAWHAAGREVYLVSDANRPPPDFGRLRLLEVDRMAIISQAPARDPSLPPRMAPLPIELVVHRIEAGSVAP